jgi:pimeloyl-ACP methyl ester carboxylesterase
MNDQPSRQLGHQSHNQPNVLWLSVSPYLKCFDQRLLSRLVKTAAIQRWEYCQSLDEPCSIDAVISSLHEYLSDRPHKTHLLGHGVSGVIALLYARRYPQRVASLTLLSVGAMPAVNWQAHYYALRGHLPCSRDMILAQMSRLLFGQQPARFSNALAQLLKQDLDSNLTLHSLAHHTQVAPGGVEVPLLICEGQIDSILQGHETSWQKWMKPGDRLWSCPEGNHFFHFQHSVAVAKAISDYWLLLPIQPITAGQLGDYQRDSHNLQQAAQSAAWTDLQVVPPVL